MSYESVYKYDEGINEIGIQIISNNRKDIKMIRGNDIYFDDLLCNYILPHNYTDKNVIN